MTLHHVQREEYDHAMADEPENMTLRLLREIRDKQDRFEE